MRVRAEGLWCYLLAVILAGGLLSACGGGGGSGGGDDDADNDLVVVKMALIDRNARPTGASGTTNAYRNNRVRLTFSAPVDESTVNDRTVRIGIPSGSGLFLVAPGSFEVDGNVVIFDPTVTVIGAPRPFGLEPNSTYSLTVYGLPNAKTVMSEKGKQVLSQFETSFMTTDLYLPDLDQPSIIAYAPPALDANSLAHLLAQTPVERNDENIASRLLDTNNTPIVGSGIWEQVWVDSRADIVIEFSEAVNPATFDPSTSFLVTNLDRDRDVFGVYKYSDDAKTVTFRPTFGYGRGPYVIRVELTVDLTDLAGNPIANPQQWNFLTEYDPTAVNEGLIEEYFDDSAYEDTSFAGPNGEATAHWNDPLAPGTLASVFGVSTVQSPPKQSGPGGVFPPVGIGTWANSRAQVINTGSEINQAAGTITQVYWMAYPGYTAAGNVWSNLTIRMGMTSMSSLTSTFANNYNVGSPVTMANAVTYTVPSNNGTTYLLLPTTKNFSYNGKDGLILDLAKTGSTGGNAAWSFIYSITGRYVYGTPSTAVSGSMVTYWVFAQFGFRTESSMAQSTWYRADSADPMFLDPVVAPTDQPAGTETSIRFEGAEDDGMDQVDPATQTGFVEDVADLDGCEYVRFQVRFTANLGTGVGPSLHEILIPYIFF